MDGLTYLPNKRRQCKFVTKRATGDVVRAHLLLSDGREHSISSPSGSQTSSLPSDNPLDAPVRHEPDGNQHVKRDRDPQIDERKDAGVGERTQVWHH
jgi:hypothetical protein